MERCSSISWAQPSPVSRPCTGAAGAFKLKIGPSHPGIGSAPHTSLVCWRPALEWDSEPWGQFCATSPIRLFLSLSLRPGKKSSHVCHSLSIFPCQAWGRVATSMKHGCQVSPSREWAVHPLCGWRKGDCKWHLLMLYSRSALSLGICLHPGSQWDVDVMSLLCCLGGVRSWRHRGVHAWRSRGVQGGKCMRWTPQGLEAGPRCLCSNTGESDHRREQSEWDLKHTVPLM